MRVSEAKQAVKEIVTGTNIVPALVGERGIGKTESLKQVAAELGWGYMAIYASSLEGPDFMGLVVKDLEAGVTRYLAPEFLPTEHAVKKSLFPEKGLLVLEEFNRAEVQTIHTLYPLLQERRINTHKIVEGWKIAVAMNPDTAAYTTNAIDVAALDRILLINVEPSVEEYTDYCISTERYDRDVLEYLNVHKEMLLVKDVEGQGKAPCPRAWSRVQELRLSCPSCRNVDSALAMELIAGAVGSSAAAGFLGYLKNRDVLPVPAEEIFKFSEETQHKVKVILDKGRLDVLNVTVREVAAKMPTNKTAIANVERFASMLPEEVQVMFCYVLREKKPQDFVKIVSQWKTLKKTVLDKLVEVVRDVA